MWTYWRRILWRCGTPATPPERSREGIPWGLQGQNALESGTWSANPSSPMTQSSAMMTCSWRFGTAAVEEVAAAMPNAAAAAC